MAQIYKKIKLDVARPNKIKPIIAKQLDKDSRYINVSFENEGIPFNVSTGTSVVLNAEKPDQTNICTDCMVNDDGTVTAELTNQTLALPGMVKCDISIIESEQKLTTTSFYIKVESASCDEHTITSSDEFSAFTDAMSKLTAVKDGKSAYQSALDGGFPSDRTETQFNSDLANVYSKMDKVGTVTDNTNNKCINLDKPLKINLNNDTKIDIDNELVLRGGNAKLKLHNNNVLLSNEWDAEQIRISGLASGIDSFDGVNKHQLDTTIAVEAAIRENSDEVNAEKLNGVRSQVEEVTQDVAELKESAESGEFDGSTWWKASNIQEWSALLGTVKKGDYIFITNDIPEQFIIGDVNMNGVLDDEDSALIRAYILETSGLTPFQELLADVNQSGDVTLKDSTMIRYAVEGLMSSDDWPYFATGEMKFLKGDIVLIEDDGIPVPTYSVVSNIIGADGKTAYQAALDGGFPDTRTEAQFNSDLAVVHEKMGKFGSVAKTSSTNTITSDLNNLNFSAPNTVSISSNNNSVSVSSSASSLFGINTVQLTAAGKQVVLNANGMTLGGVFDGSPFKLTGLSNPMAENDASNKAYVDKELLHRMDKFGEVVRDDQLSITNITSDLDRLNFMAKSIGLHVAGDGGSEGSLLISEYGADITHSSKCLIGTATKKISISDNGITLGDSSSMIPYTGLQIKGLEDGVGDKDAVNVGQLTAITPRVMTQTEFDLLPSGGKTGTIYITEV